MAIYYSIQCPHCKHIVEQGKNRRKRYGSPFRICPRCKNTYFDNKYIEPGLLNKKDFKKFSWGSLPLIALGLFGLYFTMSDFDIATLFFYLFFLALGVILLVISLMYNPDEDYILQYEITQSKERLSDPRYVIALWKAGCKITPEILQWAKKAIEEDEKNKND